MDYSKLEGKEFDYNTGKRIVRAKVVLADPDIGLTAVRADDPDTYVMCLIRPGSPKWQDGDGYNKARSEELFYVLCRQIENGMIDDDEIYEVYRKYSRGGVFGAALHWGDRPGPDSCAFAD